MKIILVSNNELSNNFYFEEETNIETKKKFRPLSIEGEQQAKKLAKKDIFNNIERIYSDASVSNIDSAKYLAEVLKQDVIINKRLHDIKIGDLKGKTVKMLSFFQEHDFTFKLDGGESLKDAGVRISSFIRNILNDSYENIVIYLPKRCILAYLINHTSAEFNLDDRLVLSYNDEVILGNTDETMDIFELTFEKRELKKIAIIKEEA